MEYKNFYEWLESTLGTIDKFGSSDVLYFRGHNRKEFKLLPTLGRLDLPDKVRENTEIIIYEDFISLSRTIVEKELSSWDNIFLMRHYKLPTRLLDWTEIFNCALYFAIDEADGDAILWVLDPFKLNEEAIGEEILKTVDGLSNYREISIWLKKHQTKNKDLKADCFAIFPPRSNNRMLVQRSVFTLHFELFSATSFTS